MIFYPKFYWNNILEITNEFLIKNEIKGLILDVDNTLIDYERNLLEGTEEWVEKLKNNNIRLCILSNSHKEEKVKKVASTLNIPYLFFGKKPLKTSFKKAKEILKLSENEIAVVGDQIFTDIIGANRSHMIPILVKPIAQKDIFITRIKRPIENKIIKMWSKKEQKKKGM